jgi:hypothetical protein
MMLELRPTPFAITMKKEDFYAAPEDVQADALLGEVFRGGAGVMIFDKGPDILIVSLKRFP